MTQMERITKTADSKFARFWGRIPVLIRGIIMGFLATTIGVNVLLMVASFVPGFWQLVVIGVGLFLYWKFFSGSWGHQATAGIRRKYFRTTKMSPAAWKWAMVAALTFVLVFQSSLMVTFRLIEFPAASFVEEYNFDAMPLGMAWLSILLAALLAGICEETGFRGYGQVPLEERYGPIVANIVISLLFVIAHLHQAWSPPVLLHIFAGSLLFGILAYSSGSLIPGIIAHTITDIFNFSYWWSDVLGKFEYKVISETGIDTHFMVWSLILVVSTTLFFWAASNTKAIRQQSKR
jgi:membrane protease YdiL (CAAX protease family)